MLIFKEDLAMNNTETILKHNNTESTFLLSIKMSLNYAILQVIKD